MRRLIKILSWSIAGLLVAAVTLPWWMSGLLALVKRPLGLEFSQYERIGYARFALSDVRYQRADVVVTAGRVEAGTPLLYGWRHWRHEPSPLFVKDWRVEVRSGKPSVPDPDQGWAALRRLLFKIMDAIGLWLPEARVETGEVGFPGGRIGASVANWRDRVLRIEGLAWDGHLFEGTLEFKTQEDLIRLRLTNEKYAVQLDLESRGQEVTGTAFWSKQPVALTVQFAARGWLPIQARAVAENWALEGQELKLGAAYRLLRGGGKIDWRKDGFVVDLTAKGEPVPNKNIPPLEVEAHGHGDLDTLTIETLHVAIPGLDAHLSEPVRLSRAGQLLSGTSQFVWEADLARQPWFSAEGRVNGEARIETGSGLKPRIEVKLTAKALKIGRWSLPQFQGAGVFDWPSVEISSASVNLGPDETIEVSGGADLETTEVRGAKLEARLKGKTVAGWWPGVPAFAEACVTAQFEGPWSQLRQGGTAQIEGLALPPLHPVSLNLGWKGEGCAVEKLTVAAASGEAQMSMSGAADQNGVRIDEWRIQKHDTTWLTLEKPARVDWLPALRCEPLVLSGEAGRLELAGRTGKEGEVRFQMKEFSTTWLRDWLVWRGPDWRIAAADFSGRWNDGAMEFSLSTTADTDLANQRAVELKLKATGDRTGVKLETLQVFEGDQEAITASGMLPVVLTPASIPRWAFDPSATMNFTAITHPDAAFWTFLADSSGLAIERPQLNLELTGSWQAPRGKIALQLPRITANPERFKRKMPVGEAIDLLVELDRGQLSLRKLSAAIDGQQVQLEGHFPVPKDGLGSLRDATWQQLMHDTTGRLQIPGADIAVLAAYAPDLLAPKGRLEANVTFTEGKTGGFVRVENAATRPLGPLGVLQDLKADLALVGRGVEIRTLEAKMAGQTVAVKGSAEINDDGSPRFDFSLRGENLPFVRQVGLLLRGDLDLKLVSADHGGGKITGKVKLRDSMFSTDLRDLVPKGGGNVGAAARAPFFSVEAKPFSAWQLDVDLSGERFLRMRTPVFTGLASLHFHLANTLAEPRATGQVTIDEGQILLPFATFSVQQGSVQLTEANPYEPTLFMNGTSRRYGYDLRLEISGPASMPVLLFSSSPPLESEQVLLLVMAGEMPNKELTYTGNQRAARFGTFIGKSLFSSVSGDSGAADRLTISAGEKVSRQGRETYEVEYSLGKRWSLVGEYDEFDDYNAGLKWRVLTDKRKEEKSDAK